MSFKVLLVYPNIQMVNLIPTNIGLLTACLKKAGYQVKIFDATFYKVKPKSCDDIRVEYGQYKSASQLYKTTDVFEDFRKLYMDYQPDMIGFSVVDATYPLALDLLHAVETKGVHVILGGIMPTFAPELALSDPQVSSICIGEGEEAIVELCQTLEKGNPIDNILNLGFRKPDGTIQKNKMRKVADLTTLPFEDFTDFESDRFLRPMQGELKRMLPVTIDRGCPYNCTFCAEPTIRKLYRDDGIGNSFRVLDLAENRLENYFHHMIETYKPSYIYFNSETFFARPIKNLEKLAKFYAKEVRLPFSCMTRIETITHERMELLTEMGCDRLSLGLEHGDDDFRSKIVGKPFKQGDLDNAFEILCQYKVPLTFFNIIGFPDETPELARKTIEMNHNLIGDYPANISASCSVFQPYYSTPLRKMCIDKGYIQPTDHSGDLVSDYILNMPQFPPDLVKGLAQTFALYCYLPKSMWKDIKVAEQYNPEGWAALAELRKKLPF